MILLQSTWSNRSNRWLDRITVDPKREAVDGWTGSTFQSSPYNTGVNRGEIGGERKRSEGCEEKQTTCEAFY